GNRLVYGLIFGLLNALLIAWLGTLNRFFFESLPNGIVYGEGLSSAIIYGLVNLILATLSFGVLGKLDKKIQPAGIVSWSWESLLHNLFRSFVSGLSIGLIYGVLMGLLYNSWILQISIGLGI